MIKRTGNTGDAAAATADDDDSWMIMLEAEE